MMKPPKTRKSSKLSRRDFLKSAAALSAGAVAWQTASGMASPSRKHDIMSSAFPPMQGESWEWQAPPGRPFPIIAWLGPPPDLLRDSAWKDMAQAGFNLCQPQNFADPESNRKALALGKKHGLGLLLRDRRIIYRQGKSFSDYKIKATVRDWASHPALAGYSLEDEPGKGEFDELARIREALARLDPGHWSYVNLFPNYATPQQLGTESYTDHVESFMETFRPFVLSYDHYCIVGDSVRPEYYENLEVIRAAALKKERPFWAFTLSTPHYSYPQPTEGHLRFQLYSNLAYGAKGLQYFTYGPALDHNGLIDSLGNTTRTYKLAAKINGEIQRMGPILLTLTSTEVFHTDPQPRATRRFEGCGGVAKCSGAPAVLGFFDGPEGQKYVMIVNRNPFGPAELSVRFSRDVRSVATVNRADQGGTFNEVELKDGRELGLSLAAGDGRLFTLKTDGP